MPRRIDKVGFEIEGGWGGKPGVSPFPDISLIREGSINGQTLHGAKPIQAVHIGEVVSEPLDYETGKWEEWLTTHWPNADPPNRTNRTCGYHIHLSTLSMKDYALLGSKSFLFSLAETFNRLGKALDLPKKHVFWERMTGQNTFCTLDFNPSRQMQVAMKGGRNRYGWLNFAWKMHKTVELRSLPTFRDAAIALRFTETYFTFTTNWLEAHQDVKLRKEGSLCA